LAEQQQNLKYDSELLYIGAIDFRCRLPKTNDPSTQNRLFPKTMEYKFGFPLPG
jgi:hypothetical protein